METIPAGALAIYCQHSLLTQLSIVCSSVHAFLAIVNSAGRKVMIDGQSITLGIPLEMRYDGNNFPNAITITAHVALFIYAVDLCKSHALNPLVLSIFSHASRK